MNTKIVVAAFFFTMPCCVRAPPDWYDKQDRSIRMPPFDSTTKIDLVVDGAALQAIRVAADDFAPPSSERQACTYTQAAQLYKVSRSGDIIFVEVSQDPMPVAGRDMRWTARPDTRSARMGASSAVCSLERAETPRGMTSPKTPVDLTSCCPSSLTVAPCST